MIRRFAAGLAVALCVVAPAFADTLGTLKESTLILREEGGKFYTLLISDAGKMEQVNSAGAWASGIWNTDSRGFCWTARGAATLCIPMPADKGVGDTWEIKSPVGKLVWVAEIQEGRADLAAVADAIKGSESGQ